jgi:DNA replication protein DnaC
MHRYFLHSGIGLAYQRMNWGMVEVEQGAVDLVKEWREYAERYVPAGVGLILHGSIGSGKTMLSALLLKELLADGWDGYFVTFSGLLDEFASGWRDEEQKRWFRDRITNADVLVVDDVGRELKQRSFVKGEGAIDRSRPMAVSTMDEVLRYRVAHCRPTIITTNMTTEDLTSDYGSNIMSLLNEKSATYEFVGSDYRRTAYSNQDKEIQLGLTRPVVVS